ncbi:MAG: ATP-binding protein [Burkholderiales bacterium]
MNKSETLHTALLCLGAAALAGALAFLYHKTEAIDLRQQNEILGLLRELKDIDSRWDLDVVRARSELPTVELPVPNRAAAARKALESLTAALQRTPSATLSNALPELSAALQQKSALIEKFGVENSAAHGAVRDTLKSTADLGAQTAALKARPAALDQTLNTLTTGAPLYYLLGQDAQRTALEAAAAQLRSAPDTLREHAAGVDAAVQTLLKAKPAEQALFSKLALLTSGPRLDNLTFSFNTEVEAALADKERYRVYLIAYAGALLVLLAYFGGNLKAANIDLERRVQERTRQLSEALQHLKDSEAQLIQSEKMSSLGQMVAGVAHEINTPLAYVKNSLGTVADKLPTLGATVDNAEKLLALLQAGNDPDGLSRQFALLSAQVVQLKKEGVVAELSNLVKDGLYGTGQMAEIVGNLKDFSRLDRSKVTSFDLNEGLQSTLLLAKHLLKAVTIDKKFGNITPIVCSPSQINQVFLNLITNAAQAMGDRGGTITLTTRAQSDGVAVDVADNGGGIPPDVLPKIFDPFFSTKEIGKGTGLGLSISYKIVQQHGGRIDVESKVGSGTRFTVWLPHQPPADAGLGA